MEEYLRKLALWHTKTFRPIITHEELEPIMATLGFVALPATTVGGTPWKEYVFSAAGCQKPSATGTTDPPPRPRLPFPRIDALHIYTYRAFFDGVAHFLGKRDIADTFRQVFRFFFLFFSSTIFRFVYMFNAPSFQEIFVDAIKGMPLQRVHDRTFEKIFRPMNDGEGIYVYRDGTLDQATLMACSGNNSSSGNTAATPICLVPLKDVIVT
ncbi:uncharacterized protein [Aristolochia californica]|uniref:uncharacterized protein n=1 Tax=Aristolochia californica TaxID=171875 RepID=UPI0035E1E8C3